jgi:hypothetical protein
MFIIISKQIGKGEYGFKKSKSEWTPQQPTQIEKFNKKQKKNKKN